MDRGSAAPSDGTVRLTRLITLPVPVDEAYVLLTDIDEVARAVPGATLTRWDGTEFAATIRLRFGPLPVVGHGVGRLTRRDPAARRAAMEVRRVDGVLVATVVWALRPHPVEAHAACEVAVRADVLAPSVGGRLGRSLVREVGDRMFDHSAEVFVAILAGRAEPLPLHEDGSFHLRLPSALTGAVESATSAVRRLLGR